MPGAKGSSSEVELEPELDDTGQRAVLVQNVKVTVVVSTEFLIHAKRAEHPSGERSGGGRAGEPTGILVQDRRPHGRRQAGVAVPLAELVRRVHVAVVDDDRLKSGGADPNRMADRPQAGQAVNAGFIGVYRDRGVCAEGGGPVSF